MAKIIFVTRTMPASENAPRATSHSGRGQADRLAARRRPLCIHRHHRTCSETGFSSITMWCHSPQAVKHQSPISSSVAVHITSTRPGASSALRCRCCERHRRSMARELVPERVEIRIGTLRTAENASAKLEKSAADHRIPRENAFRTKVPVRA
jgi:hypothetical protein